MRARGERQSKKDKSLDLADDGWEILERRDFGFRASVRLAEKFFRNALEFDPDLADAYNGLGNIHFERGHYAEAEAMYIVALKKAKDELGTDGIHDHDWWMDIDTRPYMRARYGLALSYWRQGKIQEAISELEDMLKRNPNDNQGARFLIGSMYHLKGNLRRAMSCYRSAEKRMFEFCDPEVEFNLGLVLAQLRRYDAAIFQWRCAFFENLYLPQMVINERVRRFRIWHGSNLAEPEYAMSYWNAYKGLWLKHKWPRQLLRLVYQDRDIQLELDSFVALGKRLLLEKDLSRRAMLVEEEKVLKDAKRIDATNKPIVERVLATFNVSNE